MGNPVVETSPSRLHSVVLFGDESVIEWVEDHGVEESQAGKVAHFTLVKDTRHLPVSGNEFGVDSE